MKPSTTSLFPLLQIPRSSKRVHPASQSSPIPHVPPSYPLASLKARRGKSAPCQLPEVNLQTQTKPKARRDGFPVFPKPSNHEVFCERLHFVNFSRQLRGEVFGEGTIR